MSLPKLMYETCVVQGQLIINPIGITYEQPTPQAIRSFQLCSTETPYGAGIYEFTENNFKQNIPEERRAEYAKNLLRSAEQMTTSLTANDISETIAQCIQRYDEMNLPKKELFKEEQLAEEKMNHVAEQYVTRLYGEKISQPIRQFRVLHNLMTEQQKEEIAPIATQYAATYRQLATQTEVPLVRKKLELFAAGLEAIVQGEFPSI